MITWWWPYPMATEWVSTLSIIIILYLIIHLHSVTYLNVIFLEYRIAWKFVGIKVCVLPKNRYLWIKFMLIFMPISLHVFNFCGAIIVQFVTHSQNLNPCKILCYTMCVRLWLSLLFPTQSPSLCSFSPPSTLLSPPSSPPSSLLPPPLPPPSSPPSFFSL